MIMINTKDVLKVAIVTNLVDQELVGADVAGQVLEVAGDQEVVTVPASLGKSIVFLHETIIN